MKWKFGRLGSVAAAAALVALGCSSEPTTKEALCEGYDELSAQLIKGNGIFGNPLFKSADRLGGLASTYEGDAEVQADGDALKQIADSDGTHDDELSEATRAIAAECDKPPLAINGLIGSSTTAPPSTSPTTTVPPSTSPTTSASVVESAPVAVTGEPIPAAESPEDEPGVGMRAPELRGTGIDGSPVTAPEPGQASLIVFVTHWSPHATQAIDVLEDWLPTAESADTIVVSGAVSSGKHNYPPSTWLRRIAESATVLVDSEDSSAAKAYGVAAYPTWFAVDADGNITAQAAGELSPDELDELVATAR